MKQLHRPNLFGWSAFDPARNIDFNSVLWVRASERGAADNVVIDPLRLTEHDWAHLESCGGVKHIIITNSDHVRDAESLRQRSGARVYGPAGEHSKFPIVCDAWLGDGATPMNGLLVYAMNGSKTPGELVLLIEGVTLVTGDLVRSHAGGRLDLLPVAKLSDPHAALRSLGQLLSIGELEAVLPGDGWPVFRDAKRYLEELAGRVAQELDVR
ncbi:MAG TPA: hypothetical protein VIV60_27070 [Polyangiaceae bacterium]